MKNLILISLCFYSFTLMGQTIERQVLGSGGNTTSSGSLIVTSTIGEVNVQTQVTSSIILTAGYQQANDTNAVSIKKIENVAQIKCYPNPTLDFAKLEITPNFSAKTAVELYSLEGKLVNNNFIQLTSGIESALQIDLTSQASGVYFILIKDLNGNLAQTLKLVKGKNYISGLY